MDAGNLFTSKAKYRVLGVLSRRNTPIHLRELTELAQIHLRSCQLAVQSFLEMKLLIKERELNRVTFMLNDRHPMASTLRHYFQEESLRHVEKRSQEERVPVDLLERIHELRMLSWNNE